MYTYDCGVSIIERFTYILRQKYIQRVVLSQNYVTVSRINWVNEVYTYRFELVNASDFYIYKFIREKLFNSR